MLFKLSSRVKGHQYLGRHHALKRVRFPPVFRRRLLLHILYQVKENAIRVKESIEAEKKCKRNLSLETWRKEITQEVTA